MTSPNKFQPIELKGLEDNEVYNEMVFHMEKAHERMDLLKFVLSHRLSNENTVSPKWLLDHLFEALVHLETVRVYAKEFEARK